MLTRIRYPVIYEHRGSYVGRAECVCLRPDLAGWLCRYGDHAAKLVDHQKLKGNDGDWRKYNKLGKVGGKQAWGLVLAIRDRSTVVAHEAALIAFSAPVANGTHTGAFHCS